MIIRKIDQLLVITLVLLFSGASNAIDKGSVILKKVTEALKLNKPNMIVPLLVTIDKFKFTMAQVKDCHPRSYNVNMDAVRMIGGYKKFEKVVQNMGRSMFTQLREKYSNELWSRVRFVEAKRIGKTPPQCGVSTISYSVRIAIGKMIINFTARFEKVKSNWSLTYFG